MDRRRQKVKTVQRSDVIVEFLKKLPEGRKIFYRLGNIMIEVTRDEAIELLLKEENKQKIDKEVKK